MSVDRTVAVAVERVDTRHAATVGRYLRAMRFDPCAYCGARPAPGAVHPLDHLNARQHGGEHGWENRAGVCGPCNSAKRTSSPLAALLRRCWRPEHARVAERQCRIAGVGL